MVFRFQLKKTWLALLVAMAFCPLGYVFAFNNTMFGSLLINMFGGPRNYMVLTSSSWSGNLGGLAGANAKCLADLQTNNWNGKSQVILNSSTVRAWLCDGASCQNTLANTGYVFAVSGAPTLGGQSIFSDVNGAGPSVDASIQVANGSWNESAFFGTIESYWTGRAPGNGTAWGMSGSGGCSAFSSISGADGIVGSPSGGGISQWSVPNASCSVPRKLICLVDQAGDDNTPDTFDFTDLTAQPSNTLLETSQVITGFKNSIIASVMVDNGTTRLIRKNGAGSWGSQVEIAPGDTLNLRVLSPGVSTTKTTPITLGGMMVDWAITTGDDVPNPFTLVDVGGATVSTLYETSAVLTGYDIAITVSVSAGTAEVRRNGTGAWGSSVILNPGDTLNVRMISSSLHNEAVSSTISAPGGISDVWTISNAIENMFVLSSGTFTGNLGGISGANASCLADLTANDFMNKSLVTLNASTVKAFLCDSTMCNNLNPNSTYKFARSGFLATGGASFTTDAFGRGPNDSNVWSNATYFGVAASAWTGRSTSLSNTTWPAFFYNATTCGDWAVTTGNGGAGNVATSNANRWATTSGCGSFLRLICVVTANPVDSLPDPFTLADVYNATPSTLYTASAVITGFSGTIEAGVTSAAASVSKNGTGNWGLTVQLNPGDTLEVRNTSSATAGGLVSTTVFVGDRMDTWEILNLRENLFVQTTSVYNGNLGGLAGANASCLTELQTYPFTGKGGVTLNSSTVKAFLCDSSTCQNPRANKRYYFAKANSTAVHGGSFLTNSTQQGPGDSTAWSGATLLNSTATSWTGRDFGTATLWATTPGGTNCTNWGSTASSGVIGTPGASTTARWNGGDMICSNSYTLICLVDGNQPDPFSFTTLEGATPTTLYETSVVPSGYTGSITFSASGNSAEVRKNGTGAWSTSISINAGETLNLRMYSATGDGNSVTTTVTGGTESATWTIINFAPNLFVLTSTPSVGGSIGGLAGANSKCLTNLTANNFRFKTGLTLNASTVKAFLCDTTTCQNPNPNENYYFAKSSSTTIGGASFTTDGFGRGPNNSINWATDTTAFGTTASIWTGRDSTSAALFSSLPYFSSSSCADWSNTTLTGAVGTLNNTGSGRWSSGNTACTGNYYLVCMVTSSPAGPNIDAFTLTDIHNAVPGTLYETSQVVTGITGTIDAEVTGTAEIRKNNTGAWGTAVTLSNGDTLNIRMTSSSSPGGRLSTYVTVGHAFYDTWEVNNSRDNIFVITNGTYTGSLGGLAGANAQCLTDLQTYNFQGKAGATLNSSTVRAFLCDSSICQNPLASKTYYFAKSNDMTVGGASFAADASGQGPNNSTSWLLTTTFLSLLNPYTGRGIGTATAWPLTPSGSHCTDWTDGTAGVSGTIGNTNSSTFSRWSGGTVTCNNAKPLLCMVDANAPNAFTFTNIEGATASTLYETSAVLSGFTGGYTVNVSGGGAEVRANSTGAWGSSVTVNSGDTLNLRMYSSALPGGIATATVAAGQLVYWKIINSWPNMFVATSTPVANANLGGLSGANSTCLTDLQSNNFMNKTSMTINASTVKAFLCDSATCQNPNANEAYYFAKSGDVTLGGASFVTDSFGRGPNDSNTWSTNSYFGSGLGYWTGRSDGSSTLFATYPNPDSTCGNWTSSLVSANGLSGSANVTTSTRWSGVSSNCGNSTRYLICMVTSNPVAQTIDPFTLSDISDATLNTLYETSQIVTGITGTIDAGVTGTAEIRKNNTGSWGTTVTLNNGDTLNIRMTSAATEGTIVSTDLFIGNAFSDRWEISSARENLFVLVPYTYTGNFGGLAGANATCLSELQTFNFGGKAFATLNSSSVKAFLCDGSTCQNPRASRKYFFASVGNSSIGGSYFTTDANGQGPGDSINWTGAQVFGSATPNFWTGRATTSSTLWATTSSASSCNAWTDASAGFLGTYGITNSGTATRWNSTTTTCSSVKNLICMVHGNTPDTFSFATLDGATPNTVYETSIVPTGYSGAFTFSVSGNGAEIRKNGIGSWGSSVSINAGDTLNLRMTSSSTVGGTINTTVTAGETSATWTIVNLRQNLLVATSATYTANLGGLAGANALCLTDLTNNNFIGKTGITLDASTVKAFLCDSEQCQNLNSDTEYFFALSGTQTIGGSFVTDGAARGPNNSDLWSSPSGLGTSIYYWTNRATTTNTKWANMSTGSSCIDWTSTNVAYSAPVGYSNAGTGSGRWWMLNGSCATSTYHLLCMVQPVSTEPSPFSLQDVSGAIPNTQYEVSATITGFTGTRLATASSGEVRVNNSGAWLNEVPVSPGDILNVRATSPAAQGDILTVNVSVGGTSDAWEINNGRSNLLVMTTSTYSGNLGGLAGANSSCLTELSNKPFRGKSGLILNSSTVKAFLCDGTTCNNLRPNSTYYFAVAGAKDFGFSSFVTNGSGAGPNNGSAWNVANYFGSTQQYYTGRSAGTATLWGLTPGANHCTNWTDGTSGVTGLFGNSSGINASRWSSGSTACNIGRSLLCSVESDTPTAYSFTTVEAATPATLYETSAVVSGFSASTLFTAVGNAAEVRKNGTGAWSSSVTLSSGDTLNLRMYSSVTPGASITTTVYAAGVGTTWTIVNQRDNLFVLGSGSYTSIQVVDRTTAASLCLSDLTANNFQGKTGVTLNATTVKAFICDNTGCDGPSANKTYWFASSGAPGVGGAYFTADLAGRGPGDANAWNTSSYFGVSTSYWTGRKANASDTSWSPNPGYSTDTCNYWTSTYAGMKGLGGSSSSVDKNRWSSTTPACNNSLRLVCVVTTDPSGDDQPDPFSFSDIVTGTPNTIYETSTQITGFSGSLKAVATNGAQVRKNNVGAWSSEISIESGDILNVQLLSSTTSGGFVHTTVTVGPRATADWSIMNGLRQNLFVLASKTVTGNLGGLTGAHAKCLADLQAAPFQGKSSVVLNSSTVRAFLCDGSTCINGQPNTTYTLAVAGDLTKGGDAFTTDATGLGPNNSNAWFNGTSASTSSYLITGRSAGTATQWGNSAGQHCTNWTTTASFTATYGLVYGTTAARWSSSTLGCTNLNSFQLACFVDSCGSSPAAYTFTNATNQQLSTTVSSDIVQINGISCAGVPVTLSGDASRQVRVCTDATCSTNPAWGSSASISNGLYLQLRVTSSAAFSTPVSVTSSIGGIPSTWTVTTRCDDVPNAFSFADASGQPLSSAVNSNIISLSGMAASCPATITISGDASAKFRVCNDATCSTNPSFGTTGTINSSQYLQLQLTTPGTNSSSITATPSISGINTNWRVVSIGSGCNTTPTVYSTSGTQSYTVPANCNSITVEAYGAGGGSAGNFAYSGGGGGGGGSLVMRNSDSKVVSAGGGGGGGAYFNANGGGGGGYAKCVFITNGGGQNFTAYIGGGGGTTSDDSGGSGGGVAGNGGGGSGGTGDNGGGPGGAGGNGGLYGGGGGGGHGGTGYPNYHGSGGSSSYGGFGASATGTGGRGGSGYVDTSCTSVVLTNGSNGSGGVGGTGGAAANSGPGTGGDAGAAGNSGRIVITPAP